MSVPEDARITLADENPPDLAQDKRLGPYRDACYFGLISGTRLAR